MTGLISPTTPTRPTPGGWRAAAIGALFVWAGVRTVASLVTLAVWRFSSSPGRSDRAGGSPRTDSGGTGFIGVLHHWDSNYLLAIAHDGYFAASQDPSIVGYFPGYPLVSRGVAELFTWGSSTTTSLVAAMFGVSAVASLAAATVLWRWVEATYPPGLAAPATVLFLAGPYGVFLAANYSESLFLVCALAAWYCASRNNWWLTGCWCAAATFTRINGCFLVTALIVEFVVGRRRQGRSPVTRESWWLLLAVSGAVAYFGYLAVRTGDVFAWLTAQKQGWGRGFHPPWSAFYQTAGRVLYASTPDRRLQFALDLCFAGLVLLAVLVWLRRREWAFAAYAGSTLLAMTTSFTFVSLARNSVTLFPLAILGALTAISGRRWQRALIFGATSLLFLANTTSFALGYWTD